MLFKSKFVPINFQHIRRIFDETFYFGALNDGMCVYLSVCVRARDDSTRCTPNERDLLKISDVPCRPPPYLVCNDLFFQNCTSYFAFCAYRLLRSFIRWLYMAVLCGFFCMLCTLFVPIVIAQIHSIQRNITGDFLIWLLLSVNLHNHSWFLNVCFFSRFRFGRFSFFISRLSVFFFSRVFHTFCFNESSQSFAA